MSERSYVSNGRFLHNLDNWNAFSASYSSGDGDDHYGVVVLSTGGGYISQQFTVSGARAFTIHLSVKAVGAILTAGQSMLTITDGAGNTVATSNLTGTADTWAEQTVTLGLASGTTYTLKITNVSAAGNVRIDDLWLWYVPLTRAAIATRVNTKLGLLASGRSLSTVASGSLTEGSYTYAIDQGLRSVGAINTLTDEPDVRWLTTASLDTLLEQVEAAILEQLQRDYATMVDITVGQRSENLSQIAKAINTLKGQAGGSGSGGGRAVSRILKYRAGDYEFE
jgi:hypothetical protein